MIRVFLVDAGAQKLARIRENSNFFRSELQKMGFEVLGDNDSPVMPIMLYNPAKIPAFSRECLKHNVSSCATHIQKACYLINLKISDCLAGIPWSHKAWFPSRIIIMKCFCRWL